MKRAVFLDRDGVLNVYLPGDYAKTPDELVLQPGVGPAAQSLREGGYLTVLISNQQGIGKGLFTHEALERVTLKLRSSVPLDAVYYCPHLTADACSCRKPRPGMILQAASDLGIDLAASYFVGDTPTDAHAAQAAGVPFVLVLSGQTRAAEDFRAPFVVARPSLPDAVSWILSR